MNINIKILDYRLLENVPTYATPGSAGLDIKACVTNAQYIYPGQTQLISAGFAMDIQDTSVAAVLLPRSGLGTKHGIILANTVGLIDSDYQGCVQVAVYNRSDDRFLIEPMMRLCQMVFVPVIRTTFNVVEEFEEATERGERGFGSTSLK